jgi:hypothetical protein
MGQNAGNAITVEQFAQGYSLFAFNSLYNKHKTAMGSNIHFNTEGKNHINRTGNFAEIRRPMQVENTTQGIINIK